MMNEIDIILLGGYFYEKNHIFSNYVTYCILC